MILLDSFLGVIERAIRWECRYSPVDLRLSVIRCKAGVWDAYRWECRNFPIDLWLPIVRCEIRQKREIVFSHIHLLAAEAAFICHRKRSAGGANIQREYVTLTGSTTSACGALTTGFRNLSFEPAHPFNALRGHPLDVTRPRHCNIAVPQNFHDCRIVRSPLSLVELFRFATSPFDLAHVQKNEKAARQKAASSFKGEQFQRRFRPSKLSGEIL